MNMWILVCVLGIAFGQDFQDFLDEVNISIKLEIFQCLVLTCFLASLISTCAHLLFLCPDSLICVQWLC